MIVHNSVLRTVIHVKRCAFALLMTFVPAPSWAQPCDAQNQKLFTPASFVQENQYAGKIAHRPFGKSSAFIEIIENCAVIARKPELEFVIGNAVEAHNDLEKNVGVFVQVVRFQYRDQADRITLFRLQGWLRDGRSLGIIDDQPLRGVTPTEFFEIHDGISFNNPVDGKIQIDGTKWHAQPDGGIYSSLSIGAAMASPDVRQYASDETTIYSNRLYRFQPNTGGQEGVSFTVRTNGTKRILIRTVSPNRSAFSRTIEIQFAP